MLSAINSKKVIRDRINHFRQSILASRAYYPKNISKFVFLCGANKSKDLISERRRALLDFSKKHLPHTQFFLAEKMFSTLQQEGHKENILDIEHQITKFADKIVIVLESNSSFAELGAFSHTELREKLIVINNSRFEHSESFINLGPIKAIKEKSGSCNIIHYKMSDEGIHKTDAIGDTFAPLFDLLKTPLKGRPNPVKLEECNPANIFDKNSAMFVHDIVYICGPLRYPELIAVLIQIFGNHDFKLRQHLAILSSFGAINRTESGLYKSQNCKPYFEYRFDINNLISIFRNYLLTSCPERLYGH